MASSFSFYHPPQTLLHHPQCLWQNLHVFSYIPLWKRNCPLLGLNPGLLSQRPACSLRAMAEPGISPSYFLYGFSLLPPLYIPLSRCSSVLPSGSVHVLVVLWVEASLHNCNIGLIIPKLFVLCSRMSFSCQVFSSMYGDRIEDIFYHWNWMKLRASTLLEMLGILDHEAFLFVTSKSKDVSMPEDIILGTCVFPPSIICCRCLLFLCNRKAAYSIPHHTSYVYKTIGIFGVYYQILVLSTMVTTTKE